MTTRTIRKIIIGTTQYDGAGVKLVRVIGLAEVMSSTHF